MIHRLEGGIAWIPRLKNTQGGHRIIMCLNNPIRNIDPNGDTVRLAPHSSKQFQKDYAKARALLHEKGVDDEVSQLENSTAIYIIKENR